MRMLLLNETLSRDYEGAGGGMFVTHQQVGGQPCGQAHPPKGKNPWGHKKTAMTERGAAVEVLRAPGPHYTPTPRAVPDRSYPILWWIEIRP